MVLSKSRKRGMNLCWPFPPCHLVSKPRPNTAHLPLLLYKQKAGVSLTRFLPISSPEHIIYTLCSKEMVEIELPEFLCPFLEYFGCNLLVPSWNDCAASDWIRTWNQQFECWKLCFFYSQLSMFRIALSDAPERSVEFILNGIPFVCFHSTVISHITVQWPLLCKLLSFEGRCTPVDLCLFQRVSRRLDTRAALFHLSGWPL